MGRPGFEEGGSGRNEGAGGTPMGRIGDRMRPCTVLLPPPSLPAMCTEHGIDRMEHAAAMAIIEQISIFYRCHPAWPRSHDHMRAWAACSDEGKPSCRSRGREQRAGPKGCHGAVDVSIDSTPLASSDLFGRAIRSPCSSELGTTLWGRAEMLRVGKCGRGGDTSRFSASEAKARKLSSNGQREHGFDRMRAPIGAFERQTHGLARFHDCTACCQARVRPPERLRLLNSLSTSRERTLNCCQRCLWNEMLGRGSWHVLEIVIRQQLAFPLRKHPCGHSWHSLPNGRQRIASNLVQHDSGPSTCHTVLSQQGADVSGGGASARPSSCRRPPDRCSRHGTPLGEARRPSLGAPRIVLNPFDATRIAVTGLMALITYENLAAPVAETEVPEIA